jgi:hypothetical protein
MGRSNPHFASAAQYPAQVGVSEILAENRYNMDKGGVAKGDRSNGVVLRPEGRKLVTQRSNGSQV